MVAITLDTLAYAKKLKKAGVPEKQAEAQAEITAEIMKDFLDEKFATKKDLHTLQASIKQDFANQTIRIGAMIAGGVTLAVTLIPVVLKLISLL